jgi:hypothetical protein
LEQVAGGVESSADASATLASCPALCRLRYHED